MRILQMQARNFFSFENLDLKLDPGLTVIVGPNGSGKTNLARLLRMAVDVCLGNGDPWREAERRGGKRPVSDDASTVCLSLRLDQKEELVPLGLFVHEVLLGAIQESYPGRLLGLLTKDLTKQQPTKAVEAALVIRRQVGRWNAEIQLRIDDQWVEWRDRALILPLDKMARSRLLQFLCEISSILAVRDPHMNFHKTADQIHELLDRSQIEGAVLSYDRLAARDPWFVQQVRTNLLEPLGIKLETGRVVSLGEVLGRLLQHGIQIADNIRLPYRKTRWGPEAFGRPARAFDIGNGMDLPLYLLRLQHGDPEERRKFEAVRDIFRELTGHRFNIRLDAEGQIAIALEEEFGDVPIEFESAGRWEALILSAMIAEEGRVLVLDEPALNLHPTLQRRILKRLRERKGQTILITHSPYMVPVEDVEDLRRIVRFQKEEGATRVYTLGTVEEEQKLLMTLRRSTDMASLLFARGVILTEGETESGALAAWWGKSNEVKRIGGPEAWNLAIRSVGGYAGVAPLVRLLNAWRILWAAVVDGEHLRGVMKSLRELLQIQETEEEIDRMEFEPLKAWAEKYGVFTLNRSEEEEGGRANFETLPFVRPDLEKARQEVGENKALQGWWIAQRKDAPPDVEELYRKIVRHLGIRPDSGV